MPRKNLLNKVNFELSGQQGLTRGFENTSEKGQFKHGTDLYCPLASLEVQESKRQPPFLPRHLVDQDQQQG